MNAGIAGVGGPNRAAAGIGTTVCELYDPATPFGQRWSTLGDSGIWRLYHSWTFLTRNATVCCFASAACCSNIILTCFAEDALIFIERPPPLVRAAGSSYRVRLRVCKS